MTPKRKLVYGGVSRCSQEICFSVVAHFSIISCTGA